MTLKARAALIGVGVLGVLACGTGDSLSPAPNPGGATDRWLSGYYVGYQRDLYPESAIDFSLLTHIFVGAIEATSTGGVTTDFWIDATEGPIMARAVSTRARAAARKAVLMLGGDGYHDNLVAATSSAYMATFVTNLLGTMDALGYDGIDVDWEPLEDSERPALLDLLKRLRAARPAMILTVPVGWINPNYQTVDPFWAQVAPVVDQMNIMTYGMADNWGEWVSWHQAALYNGAGAHPSSVESSTHAYTSAGIPAAKLGIGLGFFGSCWQGVSEMLLPLDGTSANVTSSDNDMSYANIMSDYYTASAYHWDSDAHAGFLGLEPPTGPQQCSLVSYEDPRSIAEKGAYVKAQGLGGAIIWTIAQGHLPWAPAGQRDPLLAAAYNSIVR
jgi:chitinase